ncbi:hypothetical protein D9M72_448650 [compost metagenome]
MHLVGTFKRGGTGFGQSQPAYLAGLHQVRHGPHGLFDRHGRIHAMLVVQVDMVRAQPLQAGLAAGTHIVGAAIDAARGRVGRVAHQAELGRQHDLATPPGDGAAHQCLVGVRAVDIGGV